MFQPRREKWEVRVKRRIDFVSTRRVALTFYTGMRIAF
jgi:hypothetical protein